MSMQKIVEVQTKNTIRQRLQENNRVKISSGKSYIVIERDDIKFAINGESFGTAYSRTESGAVEMAIDHFIFNKEIINMII